MRPLRLSTLVTERHFRLLIQYERARKLERRTCPRHIDGYGQNSGHSPLQVEYVIGSGIRHLFGRAFLQLREGGVVPCVYGKTSGLGVNFDGLSSRAYAQRTHVLRGPSLIVVDLLNQGLESVCVYLDLAAAAGEI